MSRGKLFEYAVIHHPRQDKGTETCKSAILVKPTTLLATTESEVSILAARAIPANYLDRLDEIEIIVRPF